MSAPPPVGQGPDQQNLFAQPGSAVDLENYSKKMFFSRLLMLFKDSLFYGGLIQFILITYLYYRVGKGRTWNIFFYSALSLFLAKVIENILSVLTMFKETNKVAFACFIPLEVLFIIPGYSITLINYIKLESVCNGSYIKKIKMLLYIIFPIYGTLRILIGYFKFSELNVNPDKITNIKGSSSSVVTGFGIFFSILIIYELKKKLDIERQQKNHFRKTSFFSYIRKSNYAVLLILNFIGFCLSLMSYSYIDKEYLDYITPIQCIQDNFIIILAIDTLIFKVDCFKLISNGKSVEKSSFSSSNNAISYNLSSNKNFNNNFNSSGMLSNNYSSNNNKPIKVESMYDYTKPLFSKGSIIPTPKHFINDTGKQNNNLNNTKSNYSAMEY